MACIWGIPSQHMAKEQKLSVFTVSMCNIQGCFGDMAAESTGKVLSASFSSFRPSFHTISLLSLPCLTVHDESAAMDINWHDMTHVMIRSWPQEPRPKTAFPCAFHDATGRLKAKFHETTQPSASPVRSR